ncbi:hypothetical protein TNCV_2098561 [Trichonephila clavipes]|nr:hypothetical protein TNCV_2098561 [Trichonephila clavipes]
MPRKHLLQASSWFISGNRNCGSVNGYGHGLVAGMSRVRALASLKTLSVKELIHVKSVGALSPPGFVVWKSGEGILAQLSSTSLKYRSKLRGPSVMALLLILFSRVTPGDASRGQMPRCNLAMEQKNEELSCEQLKCLRGWAVDTNLNALGLREGLISTERNSTISIQ